MAEYLLFSDEDFEDEPAPQADAYWTVSELTAAVKELIEVGFPDVGVVAEVSNVSRPRSGHLYFRLKDDGAIVEAVIWRSLAQSLPFDLEDGLEVRARGSLALYPPQGRYQLVVRSIEPSGIGPLELAFRQRFEKLKAEGLFDPDRKRPLPAFPNRIALVTSPTGAAVRDLIQVISRRWRLCDLVVVPVKVQGEGSAEEIARGIAQAGALPGVDLIITGRGGGSLEDLWAFNEEAVARAIYAAPVPVIAAVGHEIDVTIADFVADRRALTPSEAGEISVPDAKEIRAALAQLRDRLARSGEGMTAEVRARLGSLATRARSALLLGLERRRSRMAGLAARLDALSPLAVLARGYSLTLDEEDRAVVRSADQVAPGRLIRTRLARGAIVSRVESVEPDGR